MKSHAQAARPMLLAVVLLALGAGVGTEPAPARPDPSDGRAGLRATAPERHAADRESAPTGLTPNATRRPGIRNQSGIRISTGAVSAPPIERPVAVPGAGLDPVSLLVGAAVAAFVLILGAGAVVAMRLRTTEGRTP